MVGGAPSGALLGGFAIGARISCYDSMTLYTKCERVLVLYSLCLVYFGTGVGEPVQRKQHSLCQAPGGG